MKKGLLLFVFFLICHWQALHSQIIAGFSAIGIRVDTPNIYQAQVANATALQQLYFNCDTTNNVNLYNTSIHYLSGAGWVWKSSGFLIPLDSTIAFAKGIIGYGGMMGFTPIIGAWRTNAGTVISDTLNVVWSTEDSLLFNKNVNDPLLTQYWNTDFYMKYIPLRKKYGNEYLYGWMLAGAGITPNSWPTSGNFIYQITKFPQLKVLYDTVSCGSSYTFLDGFTLNNILHDTVHDFVIPSSVNGCDSLVRTKLTIPPTYLSTVYDTVCSGLSYTFPDSSVVNNLNQDTIHTYTFSTTNGCDSVIIINVHAVPPDTVYELIHICPNQTPYVWNGQSLMNSGSYTFTTTGTNSCDSTTILSLDVTPIISSTSLTICPSQTPYVWNGQSLFNSGTYSDSTIAMNGCDSITILTLMVTPITSSTSLTICLNQTPYVWNGQSLVNSGYYSDSSIAMNGCDSIAILNLNVLSPTINGTSLILCSNEIPYTWNGQSLTNTGTYTLSYLDINGCDSLSIMNLVVNPIPTPIITLSGNDLTTTQPFTTYQWFLNNNLIVGATASIYTPINNGDYRVKVIDYNGCTDTSADFVLSSLGINDNPLQHHLQIIPNPTRDRIFISSSENFINASINVYSLTGSLLLEKKNLNGNQVEVDISSLANGIYFVEIKDSGNISRLKIGKQ